MNETLRGWLMLTATVAMFAVGAAAELAGHGGLALVFALGGVILLNID